MYDVTYASVSDFNIPVRQVNLADVTGQTVTVGDELGIRLVGQANTTYYVINLEIKDSEIETPVYIILENANFVGSSAKGAIYSNSTRPIYIISTGSSNRIIGDINCMAVNTPKADVSVFGDAMLTITGGNGSNGINASSAGTSGTKGSDGAVGVIANSMYVNMTQPLTIVGGNGGNGGNGATGANGASKSASWWGKNDGENGYKGGDGCHGGNGGMAVLTSDITIDLGNVNLIGGNSGDGGRGGDGGNGGVGSNADAIGAKAGNGGSGGQGGNGGDVYNGAVATLASIKLKKNENLYLLEGQTGKVGVAGQGGNGGAGGSKDGWLGAKNGSAGAAGSSGATGTVKYINLPAYSISQINTVGDKYSVLSGIQCGYSKNPGLQMNQSSWNQNILQIDSVTKTEYFSDEVFQRNTTQVRVDGQLIADYGYAFNPYCAESISERTGFIKITRDGRERYIPVHVKRVVPISIEIVQPGKVEFVIGTEFATEGLLVKVNYNNGKIEYISENDLKLSYTVPATNRIGKQTVTVSYDHDNDPLTAPLTAAYSISVVAVKIDHIELVDYPNLRYDQGEALNFTGLQVYKVMNNGDSELLDLNDLRFAVTPSMCQVGPHTVTVSYSGHTTDFEITVTAVENYEHPWGQGIVTTEATHTTSGVMTYTCTMENCGATKTETIAPIEGHTFGDWYQLDGVYHQRDCECGVTAKREHTWNAGVVTVAATHLSKGLMLYTCTDCGVTKEVETESISGHTFEDWYDADETRHVHVCACGEKEYAGHTWNEGVVTTVPTYTEYGEMTYTCPDCGRTRTEKIDPLEIPQDAPKLLVDSKNGVIGADFQVAIHLQNNPGVTSMRIQVSYDETLLELKDVTYNTEMGGQVVKPENMENVNGSLILYWADNFNDFAEDTVFVTLIFKVLSVASAGETTLIDVSYQEEDIFNTLEDNVTFFAVPGEITFIDYIPGDINGDGVLNTKDTTRLMRYLAGWDVEINEAALDVNGDGVFNTKDTTRLMRYLAGWDVELY